MKRKLYNHDKTFFHIIGKHNDKVWPSQSLNEVWSTLGSFLKTCDSTQGIKTHAFVMMRNHYHWLCSTSENKETLEKNLLWFDQIKVVPIYHIDGYRQAYFYIYNNPVKAGVVKRAEHYPYSTLPYLLGRISSPLKFTCWDQMNILCDPKRVLNRLNKEVQAAIALENKSVAELRNNW